LFSYWKPVSIQNERFELFEQFGEYGLYGLTVRVKNLVLKMFTTFVRKYQASFQPMPILGLAQNQLSIS
jgi:hypothetical protein